MDSGHERVIELSKGKLILALLGACIFVAIGLWMLGLDDAFIRAQRRMNDPTLVHLLGGVSILFFGGGGGFLVKKLFAANRANLGLCGSPIVISAQALKISFAELLALFASYRSKLGTH